PPRGAGGSPRSHVLAAVLAQIAFGATPAQADVGGRVELSGAPPVLSFPESVVDSFDLAAEHVGTRFLACVVAVGEQAAQQLELLLSPLRQVVSRHQLNALNWWQGRPVQHHAGLQRAPLALPEPPPARLRGAVVVGHRPGKARLDSTADFAAVERRI